MDDQLQRVRSWIHRGTLKQFCTEISARLAVHGYVAECQDDTVTCYRVRKQKAGVLGKSKRETREPVLTIMHRGAQLDMPVESADGEFVALLASVLKER